MNLVTFDELVRTFETELVSFTPETHEDFYL